jgi:hypothetical protein
MCSLFVPRPSQTPLTELPMNFTGMSVNGSMLTRSAAGSSWTGAFGYATNALSAAGESNAVWGSSHACMHACMHACARTQAHKKAFTTASFAFVRHNRDVAEPARWQPHVWPAAHQALFRRILTSYSHLDALNRTPLSGGVVGVSVRLIGLRAQFIGLSDGTEGNLQPTLSRYGVRTNSFGQVGWCSRLALYTHTHTHTHARTHTHTHTHTHKHTHTHTQ